MKRFPLAIQTLLDQFAKLPGIGPKSAERFVFYLLRRPQEEVDALIGALQQIKQRVTQCQTCYDYAESNPCQYCADPKRDKTIVCVVADSADVLAIEKTSEFHGLYHVLGGVLRPTDGITPDRLRLHELSLRVDKHDVKEVIVATNPDMEGEATALYITKLLEQSGVAVTRLAKGLPMGSDLEYADEITLTNALQGRRSMNS